MKNRFEEIREQFLEIQKSYLEDMRWLREEFGLVPELDPTHLSRFLPACLDFLSDPTPERYSEAVEAFNDSRIRIMRSIAWSLLERNKENLKKIKDDPALFAEKRELWIAASWAFSEAGYKRRIDKYRECLKILEKI